MSLLRGDFNASTQQWQMPHQNTEPYAQVTLSLLYKFLFDSGTPWNPKLYKRTKNN